MSKRIRLISHKNEETPLTILSSTEQNKTVDIEGTSFFKNISVKNIKCQRIEHLPLTDNKITHICKTITQRHNRKTFIVDNKQIPQKIKAVLKTDMPFECIFIISNSVVIFEFLKEQFDFSSYVISPSQVYTFKKKKEKKLKTTFRCGSAKFLLKKTITNCNKIKLHLSGTILRENIILK